MREFEHLSVLVVAILADELINYATSLSCNRHIQPISLFKNWWMLTELDEDAAQKDLLSHQPIVYHQISFSSFGTQSSKTRQQFRVVRFF